MEKNNLSVTLDSYQDTTIEKSFISGNLEKGNYKDNDENRRKGRVGQKYGGEKPKPTKEEIERYRDWSHIVKETSIREGRDTSSTRSLRKRLKEMEAKYGKENLN